MRSFRNEPLSDRFGALDWGAMSALSDYENAIASAQRAMSAGQTDKAQRHLDSAAFHSAQLPTSVSSDGTTMTHADRLDVIDRLRAVVNRTCGGGIVIQPLEFY